jgi:hypothetical protein
MRHSQTDISTLADAIEGTDVQAQQWLEAGFSPGDAAAYVRAGCFDVDRTVELRKAGVSPSQVARRGLGWDYCAGNMPLSELLESHALETAELLW